jgi:histone acetyltransferase
MNGDMNKVTTPRASTRRTAAIDLDDAAKTDKVATTRRNPDDGDTSTAARVKMTPRRLQPTKVSDLPSPERQAPVASTTQPAAPPPAFQYPRTAYVERERIHLEREKSEETCAAYIWNTGEKSNEENCILLCKLVGIFSKCLPNMPRTYISRLVFDRRHRSVIIRRNNGRVVAGITYRPFHEKKFAEIAFCAVAQTLQVSGFGTRLMNWTKHYAREKDGMEYFLTYADNAAVGYFAKQGFTKYQTMPKDRWFGYIKDYDGGTLMECYIHPRLPYSSLPNMIEAQKKALEDDIKKLTKKQSAASVVHPALTGYFGVNPDGSRKIVENLADIPGVRKAGWTEDAHALSQPVFKIRLNGRLVEPTPNNLRQFQLFLLDTLAKDPLAWPFREPVSVRDVPDYLQTIKDPIDMGTIRKQLQAGGLYVTLDIFVADVLRMFKNAKIFNGPDSEYTKAAHKLTHLFQNTLSQNTAYSTEDL